MLGQRPECGPPNELPMVETLMFVNMKEAWAYTRPIGAGHEWCELIWTDRGGNVVHGNDHSCWVREGGSDPPRFCVLVTMLLQDPYFSGPKR